MRKLTLIPYVLTAIALAACGDKHAKSGDANAAEAPMPPNAPAKSAAFPLCNKTTMIRKTQTIT